MEFLKLLHVFTFLSLAAVASHVDLHICWKSKLPNTAMPKAVRDLLNNELLQDKKSTSFVVKSGGSSGKASEGVGKRVYPYTGPRYYKNYVGTKDQLHDDPSASFFFLKKDLHRDASMNLQFLKSVYSSAAFLPRQVADSVPFSSRNIPEILKRFSMKSQPVDADTIKKTIKGCEDPAIEGSSLESMVDLF